MNNRDSRCVLTHPHTCVCLCVGARTSRESSLEFSDFNNGSNELFNDNYFPFAYDVIILVRLRIAGALRCMCFIYIHSSSVFFFLLLLIRTREVRDKLIPFHTKNVCCIRARVRA